MDSRGDRADTRPALPEALSGLSGECLLVGATYDPDGKSHSCKIERAQLGDPPGRAPGAAVQNY